MQEEWRPIPEFSSHYAASSLGRIKRTAKGGAAQVGKVLASKVDRQGYVRQNLCIDRVQYPRKVHRLVASAFIGPIPDGFTVNHIDGDKANNRPENLEIVTRQANVVHAFKVLGAHDRAGEKNVKAKLNAVDVWAIRGRLAAGESGRQIACAFGISPDTVSNINTRKTWAHLL